MTLNKLIRFIIVEPHFRLQSIMFIIFVVVTVFQLKTIQLQTKQLKQMRLEKEMIARIPDMEKKLMASTMRTVAGAKPQMQMTRREFILRGTSIRDGIPCALIDGTVYKEGDSIGDYTVVKITRDSAVLENRLTKKIKSLQFDN